MVEKKSTAKIIEEVFYKNTYEKYYDDWIRNFALNLDNIWNGNSVRELIPKQNKNSKLSPAIIIGKRGPSIHKYRHLDLLAKSNYEGTNNLL